MPLSRSVLYIFLSNTIIVFIAAELQHCLQQLQPYFPKAPIYLLVNAILSANYQLKEAFTNMQRYARELFFINIYIVLTLHHIHTLKNIQSFKLTMIL